jgi:hypothetical protein
MKRVMSRMPITTLIPTPRDVTQTAVKAFALKSVRAA